MATPPRKPGDIVANRPEWEDAVRQYRDDGVSKRNIDEQLFAKEFGDGFLTFNRKPLKSGVVRFVVAWIISGRYYDTYRQIGAFWVSAEDDQRMMAERKPDNLRQHRPPKRKKVKNQEKMMLCGRDKRQVHVAMVPYKGELLPEPTTLGGKLRNERNR